MVALAFLMDTVKVPPTDELEPAPLNAAVVPGVELGLGGSCWCCCGGGEWNPLSLAGESERDVERAPGEEAEGEEAEGAADLDGLLLLLLFMLVGMDGGASE